ncbi:ZYBA0S06-05138g1_1 [Zygosaccharomyces bailii CLIB 213]|uniref:ZYBA0S06-05138g1_1 n=1 Tax=Zygosaccharomyces bailii (strain CLIB 213 / ATCC 58445 / CBS 680 / BCRC 21525 / NBRC 1098 / NCYC 1416 / NRRL Y-2227) TaxID=1333698 RepID=A0A8J2T8Z5_ZYGB2|nr:ZYBA0S06-05138g1_1 [Zygosaccharomyces bailii CLIB 213]
MEYIKIARVENVLLHRKGLIIQGTLHLTTHHLIFTSNCLSKEFWFSYPTIASVFKNVGSTLITKLDKKGDLPQNEYNSEALRTYYEDKDLWSFINIKIIGKDYTIFSLDFLNDREAKDVYESLLKLTVLDEVSQLYAFIYSPTDAESHFNGWNLYNVEVEFKRQGLRLDSAECPWRISTINQDYKFSPTYPSLLVVPQQISDTLLRHAAKFRSQERIPVLTYYYSKTKCCIARSAQPLPGLTKQRSVQDEKLVSEIFQSFPHPTLREKNIIVDARPTANAMAQAALGGGTESTDYYNFNKTCSRMFLGIDNIHVMSDSMNYIVDNFLLDGDLNIPIDKANLSTGKPSSWVRHIKLLLSSTETLVKSIIFNKSSILIHCSDGWDRTSQVCSLIQLCLEPYYRTIDGFMILIEKDWLSFGHKFQERSGILSSESVFHDNTMGFGVLSNGNAQNDTDLNSTSLFGKDGNELSELDTMANSVLNSDLMNKVSGHFKRKKIKRTMKFASPIFQQFLDCVYQLLIQNPALFEFNERFLRRLVYHLYSCQYGTFLYNSEKERIENDVMVRTRSVWDYFKSRRAEFTNKDYRTSQQQVGEDEDDVDWILPDLNKVQWWWQLYGRKCSEMNGPVAVINNDHKNADSNCVDQGTPQKDAVKGMGIKFPMFGLELFGKK